MWVRARAKSKLKVSYMMDENMRKDSGDSSMASSDDDQQRSPPQQPQDRSRSGSISRATSRNRATIGAVAAPAEVPRGRGSRATQAINQTALKFEPNGDDASDSETGFRVLCLGFRVLEAIFLLSASSASLMTSMPYS